MPSIPLLLGALVSSDHDLAMAVGSVMHFFVIGTVVNGAAYALVFSITGAGLVVAALVGLVHGVLIGVSLGRLKRIHPRVVDNPESEQGAPVPVVRGEVLFNDPGMFGVGWGDMTPAVVVGAYVVYSVVFGIVYSMAV